MIIELEGIQITWIVMALRAAEERARGQGLTYTADLHAEVRDEILRQYIPDGVSVAMDDDPELSDCVAAAWDSGS